MHMIINFIAIVIYILPVNDVKLPVFVKQSYSVQYFLHTLYRFVCFKQNIYTQSKWYEEYLNYWQKTNKIDSFCHHSSWLFQRKCFVRRSDTGFWVGRCFKGFFSPPLHPIQFLAPHPKLANGCQRFRWGAYFPFLFLNQ